MLSARTESGYTILTPSTFSDYNVISYEGNGCSSVVYKVRKKRTNKFYAAKIISKADMIQQHCLNDISKEITIQKMLNHPNIVKCYEVIETTNPQNEDIIIIIEEYCSKGNLSSYINKYGFKSKDERKKIELQLINSVKYMHGLGYAHCDIRFENILIDKKSNVKLSDFGCCELCSGENSIFFKNDIWSIGEILFFLSEGIQLCKKTFVDDHLLVKTVDPKLKPLVEKCTFLNPLKRPSILDLFNDGYFTITKENIKDEINTELNNENDFISKSIFENSYFDFSIDFENQIDITKCKCNKKNTKKPKKKVNQRKQLSKNQFKNQYDSELSEENLYLTCKNIKEQF